MAVLPSLHWMLLLMLGASLVAAAGSVAADALRQQQQPPLPLARDVGTPPSHDWDDAIAWANDPVITPLLTVLKDWKVPAATLAYLLNPSRDRIPHSGPSPGRSPQLWFAAGFGMPFNAPMRVASVSKPLVEAVWGSVNATLTSRPFFELWTAHVGALPEPLDARVKQITVAQLLDHTSGFSNAKIGYDPAFQGKSVSQQIGPILKSTTLATDPGTTYSYSNFGYMILARLAQGITRRSWLSLNQRLFPAGAPIFEASDTTPAAATAVSAAEPSLYWIQAPDGPFKAKFMAGNGNIVSNAVTLAWFGTQYWIGGAGLAGKRISTQPNRVQRGIRWIFNGSMPGTLALLAQLTTQSGRVGAICIIIPTRMANADAFLDQLNSAALDFMAAKFEASPCAGQTCSGHGTNCKTKATQGLRTGGIVARPAEYRPYLTNCSWLNRPYNGDTMSAISPVKCTDPANPADAEWYLFMYNSGQANWASIGLTEEIYSTAKFDASCSGTDCYVLGCARESCCFAMCASIVVQGGQCVWKYFDAGGGVMRRWYDIRPVNQPSTACDPRGGGGKGSGSGRGGGNGRRHLLGRQPSLATTGNNFGPLQPAPRAHRRSLQQDVAVVPDRYLCDPQIDPLCYRFSYEWSIAENGTLTIVNIDCPCCPQDNALAVQLVAQML